MTQDIVSTVIYILRESVAAFPITLPATLGTSNDIAALCGTRVYRKRLPIDAVFPAIAVRKISDIRPNESSGPYSKARVQCTTLATSDVQADILSEIIADRLNKSVNTVINHTAIIGIEDGGASPGASQDSGIEVYHRDFMVDYCNI